MKCSHFVSLFCAHPGYDSFVFLAFLSGKKLDFNPIAKFQYNKKTPALKLETLAQGSYAIWGNGNTLKSESKAYLNGIGITCIYCRIYNARYIRIITILMGRIPVSGIHKEKLVPDTYTR